MPISQATSSRQTLPDASVVERPGRASGFTLLEMLVVLVILSLAAGIVMNRIAWQPSSPADFARSTAAALRAASGEAIRGGRPTVVSFDLGARTLIRDGAQRQRWPESLNLTVEAAESESGHGLYSIRFLPDGGSTGLRAVFESPGMKTAVVTVSWLTGEVRDAPR